VDEKIALTERRGEPTRCPFCLDRVQTAHERRCDDCGAPHHAACLTERGACAVCQRGGPLVTPRSLVDVGPAPERLRVTAGPDGLTFELPPPSLAALGPPLGMAVGALYLVVLASALHEIGFGNIPWFWVLGMVSLFVYADPFSAGLALISRAVGRERLRVDLKHLLLERRALGRFGETIAMPLEDITSIRRSFGGRVRVETTGGGHSFGRGLTDPEAAWLADALSARLPG
jgi:hypothetical protein